MFCILEESLHEFGNYLMSAETLFKFDKEKIMFLFLFFSSYHNS